MVESPHKDVTGISEQLAIVQVEHQSKYLESKRNKINTPSYETSVTEKDHLWSDDTPNKWQEGTISIVGDSYQME